MLESAVGREHVKIQNGSLPSKRWKVSGTALTVRGRDGAFISLD